MPTENRSSNTEMVSELLPCPFCGHQDVLIERLDSDASVVICQGLTGPHEACLARGPVGVAQNEGEEQPGRDKAVELWNARAEQHQGEPIGEVVAFGKGLHEIAWSQGKMPRLGAKLYTHADPGEVERLRAQVRLAGVAAEAAVHEQVGRVTTDYLAMVAERDALRAQLAERDALLREIHDGSLSGFERYSKIEALLSASAEPIPFPGYPPVPEDRKLPAEPSAPVEHDHDALVAAVCVLRSQGLGNLSEAVEAARAALERKPS